jgi:hypothetical protein
MLVDIPGRGQVNLDLPEDITQEELDKLTPEINQKLAALPTTEEAPQEVPAEEAVTEPAQAQQGGLQSWNDYQVASNFDKADFEKKKELFDTWRGKTLQAVEPTGALQTATGRKQLNDQFKQIEKAFQLDRPDRNVLEKYVFNGPELFERGTYGFKQYQLSEATEALEKAAAEKDQTGMEKAASDVKRLNEEISKLAPPKETVGDIFLSKSVLPNFAGAMVEQLSMLTPKIATNADAIVGQTLAGAGIGAGVGVAFDGVGAIPGAIQGAKQGFRTGVATATGKSSYELEYSGTLMGLLSGEIQKDIRAKNIERVKSGKEPLKDPTPGFDGINVNDPEQLVAAMQNEELMGTIKQAANEKGVPVGVVDGLTALATFGLSSAFESTAAKAGLKGVSRLRKVAETGGLFLTEVTGGMGGEALSQQLAYGDITDPNAIAMEGALEVGGGAPVIAAARGSSRADLVAERLRNFAPKTSMALAMQDFRNQSNLMTKLMGDQKEQDNNPFTFDRGSFDTLNSGLDDTQKESAFNRAKRLTGMAMKEAYNVLGANPDKPITIKFSDNNRAFSIDTNEENTVQINLDLLKQELSGIDQKVRGEKGGNAQLAEKRRQTYLISAMAEELIHDTDMTKARANLYQQAINRGEVDPNKTSFSQWRKEFGEKGASQMTEKEIRDTRAQYGDENLSGNNLYSEFVRQLIQRKKIGVTTEDTWQNRKEMAKQKAGILEESLLSAKDYWQRTVRGLSKDSPVVKEHLKAINSLLDEKQKAEKIFQKGSKKAATTATAAVAPVETEGEGQPQETATPVEAVQPDAPTEGSEAVPAPLEPEQPSRLTTLQAKFDETSNKIAEIEASPVPDEVELEQDRYRQLDALNVVRDNIQKEIEAEKIKAPAPKAKATPAPKPAKKATPAKVNPSSLKRFQARGKYGSVRLVFPDQNSADAYDSGRRRDGKDRKKDSATLQKRETTIRNLVAKKILGDPVQASQKLTEYRQMIRDSIVKAEEGDEVAIPSFEAFVGRSQPQEQKAQMPDEPTLSIPEDEETLGAAPITRETPRGQEAAQGQYFNSIDVTVNSKMGDDVNPNADKILDSLINDPEMVNETVKYFAGYIRNNPVFKFELERMGIKTPSEVANEALIYLMTASRETNFPENGSKEEQKTAVFRSIKNKLSRLISTELEQKLKRGPTEKAEAPTQEQVAEESDPQMEEEVAPQIEAPAEEQATTPIEEEPDAPTVTETMDEREKVANINPETGEAKTARTANWGDRLGEQVPDTIESQEVPEYTDAAFDENGQAVLSVEPEILDKISRESKESVGQKLNKIIAEAPFTGAEKEIFDNVFRGNLQAKFNPYSQKIEITGYFESEKDATRTRNLSSGEKKRRQRARERVEKWMSETLRPSMIKEIGTLRFANASPGILKKLGLKRYRLGDVLGAAKITSEPDTKAIDRLPDFDPYWMGPKGEIIPVESSAIRYEGMDSMDSHAGEMIMWLQENEPEIYKDLQQKYGYSLGKNVNNEMFSRGWLRMTNDGNNILLEGKPGRDQIDLLIQKAISLELGVVHDRWPSKSKTLFKPLTPEQISNVVGEMDIFGAAKVAVAAMRDRNFKSLKNADNLAETRFAKRGKNLMKLASIFGYEITDPTNTVGGWDNPDVGLQLEPSVVFTLPEGDPKPLAALLASNPFSTPEVQRAVYIFDTNVTNPTDVEHEVVFKDRSGLNKFVANARKLGFEDGFGIDTASNTLYLGVQQNEQTQDRVSKFFEAYKGLIKEARSELGQIQVIEQQDYSGLLEQLGNRLQDIPDDFTKGLAAYHLGVSRAAIGGGSVGESASPQANRRIRGWSKAQSSARLLRQAKEVSSRGPIMVDHVWVPVRKEEATKIAEAYENLPDFDPSEEVKRAYESLASEIEKQWKFATEKMGMRFEPWTKEGQPYETSSEMRKDVRSNNRLFYFTGGESHPYLGQRDENGVSLNEKLRAIHDLFGHAAEGYGFGPRGEENAWIKHSQMFSDSAQRALTTETRGQNSWFNFGPHRYSLLNSDIKSEKGTAPYAKQKVALLPEEFTRWQRIPEVEVVIMAKTVAKRSAPEYDPITGKRLPGMTAEEIELLPEMMYPEKKLNYSGVKKDDQKYLAEQERLAEIRRNEPAPWEIEAPQQDTTIGAASPSQQLLRSVAGFNFPLRRMKGYQKMSFARKMESENYWTDVNEKNRTLQNVISDFSVFEDNTAVLDFWNDLLGSFSASPKESFKTNLLRAINASSENKDRVLAATASMFKVPLMRTKAGEAFVMMPGVGGSLALMESNGKFTYVETAKLNPDEGYMAANRLDANKFASGRLPQVPKNGTAERVLFDDAYKKLAEAYRFNGSPETLKDAASFVAKYVPSEDLVRFLQAANGATFEDAKEIVYGDRLHAARITPIEPSEMELTEIGATTFNPENPVSGLMTAKGALIEGGNFDSISETELFSKKDLSSFKKNWLQVEVSDAGLKVTGPKEPTDEQQMQLAKVIGYAKKPVFLNGKAFDYKKAIRKNAFIDSFVRQIEESYLEADDQIDENGNYRVGLLDNPDFRRRNYDLFKQIEKFRNSTEAFNDTMEKVFADFQEEGLDRGTFDRLRTIFKGDSVPALTAVLTHEVFPSISPASRDFIASRLPYFLKATPNSEVLNLVTKLKEFKDWFGNSKVTRPDGSPAVQYYVATSDIRAPNTLGTPGGALTYSRDQVRADDVQFSVAQAYQKDGKPRMKTPVFVRAENPLRMASVPEHVFDGSVFIKEAVVPMLSKAIADQTGMKLSEVSERIKTTADAIEEQSYPYLADSTAFANTFFQGVLKSFGFDSIELGEANADDKAQNSRFVVFNADQLKLANGLNSDFTSSPDILGAASIGGFKYQPENKFLFDESKVPFLPRFAQELLGKYVTNANRILGLRRFWQDKFIDLKKIQESIEKQIGEPLPDSLNAYQLEELYHGKVGARLTDFNENIVEPILQKLRSSGISTAEIEEFMYALHAKERNARIRLINPMPPEPYFPGEDATPEELAKYNKAKKNKEYIEQLHERGSGMTDAEADDLIAKYKADDRATQLEESRQMIRQMIDGALRQRLDEGLISRPLFEALTDRYKDYVPLKGIPGATAEEIATSGQATGKGFNIRGEEVKPTLGRLSRAENILAYAMNSAAAGIVRAEKNVLGNALYELVQTYPDSDLWEIAKPQTVRRLVTRKDPESGEAFQYARDFIDPTWMNQDDIFATKINGETKFIRIKNPDLVRNLKNGGINSENWSSKVVGALATFNRLLSITRTGLSPEFFFTNPIRDLQTAAFNLSAEQYKDLSGRVVKSVLSLKPLRTSLAEEFNPNSTQDEWGDSYRAFLKAGGKLIGWVTGDIETQIKDVQKIVDGKDPSSAQKFLKASSNWVEKMNGGVENATRLAVFHHARELGATDQQAAAIARNATVNFTKKGEAGPVFNSIYLFFNASLQGSARLVQSVATSPKVRKLAVGAVTSGLLASMFNEASGGDDEDGESFWSKVPEFKKRTNIIIMLPGTNGRYVSLPLPYGYNTFWHTGNILSDLVLGKKTNGNTAVRMAETLMESFNPIGGARNLLSSITPTVFQPITDIYLNQDWAGRPITPSDFPGDASPTPASEKYFNSVTPAFKHLTKFMNEISGGNEVREGALSFSPEYMDYFAGYLTGAVGSTILRVASLPEKILNPNESLGLNDIPILRRFVSEQPSYADYERFSAIRQAAYTAIEEQKLLGGRGDAEGAQKASEKYAAEINVYPIVRSASGQLQKVKQQLKAIQKQSEEGGDDRSAEIKALKDRQKEIIMGVSKAYNEALSKQKN